MDQDGAIDVDASPRAPLPKLKSVINGGSSSSLSHPRKTEGRSREEADVDRQTILASCDFDSLNSDGGPGPKKSDQPLLIPPAYTTVLISNKKTPLNGFQKLEGVPKLYTYEELAKATGSFSNKNQLGVGGCGQVFKGEFPNGEVVAIKKLKYEAGQSQAEMKAAQLQFEVEIQTLIRIRHRNLVKLLGYCNDEADRLFVCEFVPNNSLKSHLHGNGNSIVIWSNRMKIALGTAKGLTYLHEGCNPRVIHRDIKSENILLDKNFEPKIADFGLAKDPSDSTSHISTEPKGTFGYFAPECFNNRQLTDKSDVFSFGIVLLELITGKPAVDDEGNDRINLADWARPRLKQALYRGKYSVLVDSKLQKAYKKKDLARMTCCAAACVYKPAKFRPKMSQIVEVLQGNMVRKRIWRRTDKKFLYDGSPYYSSLPEGSSYSSYKGLISHCWGAY
ncbi:hypothetical protein P3X46_010994 [Hevea brasiliensis]|uniref:non-specific serine/threonine protein kinase n=1 Tax=Hevea brasiliensis TaxID=3981 RepID=A0ABQ9MHT0_HEVBR|nr:proline-rich receptor-like protein kinase PERK1 isoform X2 [Hevea brasiliensis]KAJ9179175.1 hypothetical protein P3X46_010994 [Hevea brasiliensis]